MCGVWQHVGKAGAEEFRREFFPFLLSESYVDCGLKSEGRSENEGDGIQNELHSQLLLLWLIPSGNQGRLLHKGDLSEVWPADGYNYPEGEGDNIYGPEKRDKERGGSGTGE